jgi:hypothetical protein
MSESASIWPSQKQKDLLRSLPHPVIPTNLEGTYLIPLPPDDFDASAASPDELVRHGMYWAATPGSNPAIASAKQRLLSRKWLSKNQIAPLLTPRDTPSRHHKRPFRPRDESATSPSWSGAALGTAGIPWVSAVGIWNVPTVSQPGSPAGQKKFPDADGNLQTGWNSASWVGIDGLDITEDGSTSNDVLQGGIQQGLSTSGEFTYVAWYEWFVDPPTSSPAYVQQTDLTGFAVSPGDQILCWVQYLPISPFGYVFGNVSLANFSTGQVVGLLLTPPPGASFSGDSVEWIMEAPGGEPITSLPRFTDVIFTSCAGVDSNGETGDPGSPGLAQILNIVTPNVNGELVPLTDAEVSSGTVTIEYTGQ